jgi:hypothetical protein
MDEYLDLPWVHTRDGIEDAEYSHLSSTQDGFGDVATVWSPNAKTKTAYIVLAANNHHQLMEALEAVKLMLSYHANEGKPAVVKEVNVNQAWHAANNALAAVKEASNERS